MATLLLIVIAIAAIIVTYAWITTYMGTTTTHAGVMIEIENVYWDTTNNKTIFYVKNTGTSDAKIVRLYMGDTSQSLLQVDASYTNIGSGISIPAGGSPVTIELSWPNNVVNGLWEANKLYHFRIVPNIGEAKYFTARAPP